MSPFVQGGGPAEDRVKTRQADLPPGVINISVDSLAGREGVLSILIIAAGVLPGILPTEVFVVHIAWYI